MNCARFLKNTCGKSQLLQKIGVKNIKEKTCLTNTDNNMYFARNGKARKYLLMWIRWMNQNGQKQKRESRNRFMQKLNLN